MKIEKLSENQIRCTLNKSDLASRQLKISELAYGSEKAKELFRDMMLQASYELGFEADDIPLMIEAIPVSADCIVLIITKVDDPDELDTRFSKFSPADSDYEDYYEDFDFDNYGAMEEIESDADYAPLDGADANIDEAYSDSFSDAIDTDVFDLFNKVKDYLTSGMSGTRKDSGNEQKASAGSSKSSDISSHDSKPVMKFFSFDSLDNVSDVSRLVADIYNDFSHLYKDSDGLYYLALYKKNINSSDFNKACNIISEYGTRLNIPPEGISYFDEHFKCIIANHALQAMARI